MYQNINSIISITKEQIREMHMLGTSARKNIPSLPKSQSKTANTKKQNAIITKEASLNR
jgi:hypothetical protein